MSPETAAPPAVTATAPAPAACCGPTPTATLTASEADAASRTLKALADPTRLRLLALIAAHEGGDACVCDLTEPVGLSQPTVSHHLKVLTEAGFLTREKRGVWAHYAVVPGALRDLVGHLAPHLTPTSHHP